MDLWGLDHRFPGEQGLADVVYELFLLCYGSSDGPSEGAPLPVLDIRLPSEGDRWRFEEVREMLDTAWKGAVRLVIGKRELEGVD